MNRPGEDRPNRRRNKTNNIFCGILKSTVKYIYLWFRSCLDMAIDFVFSFVWEDQRKAIPDLSQQHRYLSESAVKLAERIKNKEISSEELVKMTVERIKAVNPIVNAVTDERYNAALEEAREVDKIIASGVSDDYFKKRPFLGVPFTTKESHAIAGMRHTLGTKARENERATEDARSVELLREAGAIPVAVTNVPEINKWQETCNNIFGLTRNPYHTGRTVGGSSGGEGALMASMATPISLCSDIGGSTRMPAFFCGLFGHYLTPGITNVKGLALRTGKDKTMSSIGFISRHVEDLAPLHKIVAGEKAHLVDLDKTLSFEKIKFFYVDTATDIRISPISADMRNAMSVVINRLTRDASLPPTPYTHEAFSYMFTLWKHRMTYETEVFARMLTNGHGEAQAHVELLKKLIGKSDYTLAAVIKLLDDQAMPVPDRKWAQELIGKAQNELKQMLGTDGVLLFPSSPHPAPYHYSAYLRPFNFAYWGIFNALGFPATQVPLGLNKQGIPLGIQVIAAPHNDALCFNVAKYLEKEFGGFVPPCKVLN